MIRLDYQAIDAAPAKSFAAEISGCIDRLESVLEGESGRILTITFFAATDGSADFARKKRAAARALDQAGIRVPWSFIAQPPARPARVSLYAETLPRGARAVVRRRRSAGSPYGVVESGGGRTLVAAGLTGSGGRSASSGHGRAALAAAGHILAREGLTAGDIVRQWNYLPDILAVRPSRGGLRQNYQEFNESRREFYAPSVFPSGYPAATGIGTLGGGVVVELRAAAPRRGLRVIPLSNPLQQDAHRYSGAVLVGGREEAGTPKAAPLFERAKFVGDRTSGIIYVSGTAAIREQSTVAAGDAAAQTRITIENIRGLISAANLRRHGIPIRGRTGPLAYLRAYVRREQDVSMVRTLCRTAFGSVPAHFVRADICRDELLVEMEVVLAVLLKKGI